MPSFQTPAPIVASIGLSIGTVHVIASDRTDTLVAVNPSDRGKTADVEAARDTVVDLTNRTLSITAPRKSRQLIGWRRSGSVDVTVEVPEGSSLRADAGVADFRCDGRLDEVEVKTGVGNVRLDQTGTLRAHCGAGRLDLEESTGDAEIRSAGEIAIGVIAGEAQVNNLNGKTWIGRVGGNVKVRSANGDVTIEDAGRDVTVKTANGNIRLGQVARGSTTIESGAGGLEIGVREGTAAWIDANTRFGRIQNRLSPSDQPEPSTETLQVHARTAFGDVLIKRS